MRATRVARRVLMAAVVVTALGCGGDDGGGEEADDDIDIERSDDTSDDSDTTETTEASEASDDESAGEGSGSVPADTFELAQACEIGERFDGLPAFESGADVHPIVLFDEIDSGGFIYGSYELPSHWGPDPAFADGDDLAVVELVGCLRLVDERPTGQDCEFDDDNDQVTLELVDGTYEVEVLAAATGEPVETVTVDSSDDGECPFFITYEAGDTEHLASLDDEDIVDALQPIVES